MSIIIIFNGYLMYSFLHWYFLNLVSRRMAILTELIEHSTALKWLSSDSNIFVLGEWYSEWGYLTDQFPSTAIFWNTCAMEFSYLANSFHISTHSDLITYSKNIRTQTRNETPEYEANTIAYYVMFY